MLGHIAPLAQPHPRVALHIVHKLPQPFDPRRVANESHVQAAAHHLAAFGVQHVESVSQEGEV